jgi:hypothetical protein
VLSGEATNTNLIVFGVNLIKAYIRNQWWCRHASSDLPTDPLLAGHTRKNALSPVPDRDPRQVIVFTRKIRNGCNQQKIAARQFGELFL